jgi:general secretion pathway protein A
MYERFFGLVDAPFRLTPDPRYLFLSRKHAEALAHLQLGLSESSGFVCITGDVGTGKTTILRSFLADLGPEVATAYIFNPAVTALELIQRINRELGIEASGETHMELVDALNTHLLAQRKAGGLSVVVIDEAQAFSIELLEHLRLLSNLETTTEKLLRVVLVGQPQLRGMLVDPSLTQLNQRITLRCHMGPLAGHETVEYVRHRLAVASRGKAVWVFTRPALTLVHRLSGGVPRLVNMIAHRSMLAAYVARRRRVTARCVLQAYREIGAVPLPRRAPRARRLALAAGIAAVAVGVATLGIPRVGDRFDVRAPASAGPEAHGRPAEPAPASAEAADEPAAPSGLFAFSTVDLERRLAELDAQTSAAAALRSVLGAWHARPLEGDEVNGLPSDIERVAWRRGLDDLRFEGNRSMLRLLDLPAVLELRVPRAAGPRYAALVGMTDTSATLALEGTTVTLDLPTLERFWFGQAHVLWRDFEGLGPTFGANRKGLHVDRLQVMLRRAGAHELPLTGEYDEATANAVLDFQRSRLLAVDGQVGRLTRIVLYAAAGGYARPTLAVPSGGPS